VGAYAETVGRVEDAVLGERGELDPPTRAAIADHAAGAGEGRIPSQLVPYVDKVGRHAYKVTDGDVRALRARGYSEDAIFEATLAAAVGAARTRLRRGLAALEQL
jgi:hypothetical protein